MNVMRPLHVRRSCTPRMDVQAQMTGGGTDVGLLRPVRAVLQTSGTGARDDSQGGSAGPRSGANSS